MRGRRRHSERVERYAGWLQRLERVIDRRWRRWAMWLQARSDRLSVRQQYGVLVVFCVVGVAMCVLLMVNVFKHF